MKALSCLLALLLCSQTAFAETLRFSGRIQKEDLAEEAIDLLHCLSDRMGLDWELSESDSLPRLELKEESGRLKGAYLTSDKRVELDFGEGGAQAACEQVAPAPETAEPPANPLLPMEEPRSPSFQWGWLGVAAAAAGIFFLWKSKRPDHRSLTME